MSLNDWYNSLNNELRIKMIKFNPLRGKEFISSFETNDQTHLEGEEDDFEEQVDDYDSNN